MNITFNFRNVGMGGKYTDVRVKVENAVFDCGLHDQDELIELRRILADAIETLDNYHIEEPQDKPLEGG